jgi:hypothetical protein
MGSGWLRARRLQWAEVELVGRTTTQVAMSELGQSRHFDRAPITSGLPLRTDIGSIGRHVSKVP